MQDASDVIPARTPYFELVVLDHEFIEEILALWASEEALRKSTADNVNDLERYFERNPGISVGATDKTGSLIATVLAGHDGRRGYPKHIFVHPTYRRTGVGLAVMREVIVRLANVGITTCHYSVDASNRRAYAFFQECFSLPEFTVEEIVTSRRFELRYKGTPE